jgi:hypothetical protein
MRVKLPKDSFLIAGARSPQLKVPLLGIPPVACYSRKTQANQALSLYLFK